MPKIYVCPLSRLHETVADSGARQIVTLINAGTPVDRPSHVTASDHLFLAMNDIVAPIEGMTRPDIDHVRTFLAFVEAWDRHHPMVIHCWAGVSRSTAAAYVALCALRPDLHESELAWLLRESSPEATPNGRIVDIADNLLERRGRMVSAIAEIGRGVHAYEGAVFSIELEETGISIGK